LDLLRNVLPGELILIITSPSVPNTNITAFGFTEIFLWVGGKELESRSTFGRITASSLIGLER